MHQSYGVLAVRSFLAGAGRRWRVGLRAAVDRDHTPAVIRCNDRRAPSA
jgi:hypothetical protein